MQGGISVAAQYTIDQLKDIITPIAKQYGVESISLFGSYSKGNPTDQSDVDLKVEKGRLKSLFQLCGFRLAVEDALHLPVDLITTEASDPDFLDMIARDEVLLYRKS